MLWKYLRQCFRRTRSDTRRSRIRTGKSISALEEHTVVEDRIVDPYVSRPITTDPCIEFIEQEVLEPATTGVVDAQRRSAKDPIDGRSGTTAIELQLLDRGVADVLVRRIKDDTGLPGISPFECRC